MEERHCQKIWKNREVGGGKQSTVKAVKEENTKSPGRLSGMTSHTLRSGHLATVVKWS